MAGTAPILQSQLTEKDEVFIVTLYPMILQWKLVEISKKTKSRAPQFVPVSDIITVNEESTSVGEMPFQSRDVLPQSHCHRFTVYYVQRKKQHQWLCSTVTFCITERLLHQQWMQAIEDQLNQKGLRPRNLLVFINPIAATQQALDIYQFKVAPLFKLAKISTVVIETDYANHARDYILATDIQMYDGIVCVGGDGMFSELMHGIIRRTQIKAGVDSNNSKAKLVQCPVRIGIIPAGSINTVCYSTTGLSDPVTSALHIIVGDCQPLDVCSVHQRNKLLKYSVSLLGYGFYGDVLKHAETNRRLGASRYDLSAIKVFLQHHLYKGSISFRLATGKVGSPGDKCRCLAGCSICSEIGRRLNEIENGKADDNGEDAQWEELEGKFLAIAGACISCCSLRNSKGLSPSGHLGNGALDLIIVRKCSKFNFLRYLIRHVTNADQFDFPFVAVYRVQEFKFMPYLKVGKRVDPANKKSISRRNSMISSKRSKSSVWNSDGELVMPAAIEVKVHCQLIKLFARGIEANASKKDKAC